MKIVDLIMPENLVAATWIQSVHRVIRIVEVW